MNPGVGGLVLGLGGMPLMISLIVKRVYSSSTGGSGGGVGVALGVVEVEVEGCVCWWGEGKISFLNQNFFVWIASRTCAVCMFSST